MCTDPAKKNMISIFEMMDNYKNVTHLMHQENLYQQQNDLDVLNKEVLKHYKDSFLSKICEVLEKKNLKPDIFNEYLGSSNDADPIDFQQDMTRWVTKYRVKNFNLDIEKLQ